MNEMDVWHTEATGCETVCESRSHFMGPSGCERRAAPTSCVLSEAGRRQDVHVSGFELVWSRSLTSTLHCWNLHFGRGRRLSSRVVCQPRGLRLHYLHGGRLLGTAVRLQRKACWEKRKEAKFSYFGRRTCTMLKAWKLFIYIRCLTAAFMFLPPPWMTGSQQLLQSVDSQELSMMPVRQQSSSFMKHFLSLTYHT